MEKTTARIKKWGNSLGIVLPKALVENQNLKEGIEIEIFVQPKKVTKVKDVFGILKEKMKKSTEEIMKEVDTDFWPEDK